MKTLDAVLIQSIIHAPNDNLVLAIVLYRPSRENARGGPPGAQRVRPDVNLILAIVGHKRRGVAGLSPLAPSACPSVRRAPHEKTIGEQLLQKAHDVIRDALHSLVGPTFLVVRIEEVVVDDVADGEVGGRISVGDPNLPHEWMRG